MDREQQPQTRQPGCGDTGPDRPVITVGALYAASQAFLQGTVKNLAESKQQPKPLPVAEIRRAEPETDWSKVVDAQARRDAMSQPQAELPTTTENTATKQTVFNDLNYKP